ncbi:hypothetical protein [Lysobacter sp. HA35]
MRTEHTCGRVGVHTLDEIAHKAATLLLEFKRPWALTMDPEGLVMLERPQHAHPDDLLGVFNGTAGLLGTSRLVLDEVRHAVKQRPPRERTQRRVLQSMRPKRAA